ncbi:MAG: hypothetical protein JO199_12320 [Candidatus Eremiobacteraeota bacterium]|nr:hypothetical protein [Candidatus Eremiobacteraeota bacterium]
MDNETKVQRRDRRGEIFENDLTEEDSASPPARDDGAHAEKLDPNVDSQEGDAFMKERYGKR